MELGCEDAFPDLQPWGQGLSGKGPGQGEGTWLRMHVNPCYRGSDSPNVQVSSPALTGRL